MNLARKFVTGAIAAGIAATGLLAATPASAATGGGCDHDTYGMSACISASGGDVVPDFYITILPAVCTKVEFALIDLTANKTVWSTGVACEDMHGGPWHIAATSGHSYLSELTMTEGANVVTSRSPISYF